MPSVQVRPSIFPQRCRKWLWLLIAWWETCRWSTYLVLKCWTCKEKISRAKARPDMQFMEKGFVLIEILFSRSVCYLAVGLAPRRLCTGIWIFSKWPAAASPWVLEEMGIVVGQLWCCLLTRRFRRLSKFQASHGMDHILTKCFADAMPPPLIYTNYLQSVSGHKSASWMLMHRVCK